MSGLLWNHITHTSHPSATTPTTPETAMTIRRRAGLAAPYRSDIRSLT